MKALAIAIGLAAVFPNLCRAQQTIFNVPSQDVLAPGSVYAEVDGSFRTNEPRFVAITPRVVFGYGYNFEGGLNLPGYINIGDKLWAAHITLKYGQVLDTTAPWTLTEGVHLYLPLTSGRTVAFFAYAMTGYKLATKLRLDGGVYIATDAFTGIGNVVGALGSIEYALNDWLTLALDAYSGQNALGFVTPGLFVGPFGKWILYPAYQISNVSRDGDSFLVEIGYSF
ncbi:MAG: hypothetical protein Q8913_08095 [Bacteroidota bacterium]|nr:hypothetical protein [Bacteroidota bacterium]